VSPRSVLRSHRPQTRLEASCTRTRRPPGRLGPNRVETGPRRRKLHGGHVRFGGVGPRNSTDEAAEHREGQASAEAVEGRAWPKENIARPDTFPTQSGRTRVPGVGRCAAGSLPPTPEGGAVCANGRPYGSMRGVPGDRHPYRDWIQDAKTEIPEKQKEFWVW